MNGDPGSRRRVGGGRFELVERLGSGAMGTVWRAVDKTLDREVALKEVRAHDDTPADDVARLHTRVLREAQALARLQNPHVATVHQIVDDEPFPWIVMEFVPGRSLAALLADGPLAPREAAGIAADVLDALAAAHGAGVLHRDVKPANVLVRPDGRAVLVDFGIAALEGSATITGTGTFAGTIEYIAPERAAGQRPTPASDLWSLGVLLYVAVEGHSPFRRPNHWATIAAIVNDAPPPPRRAGQLTGVIDALLAKDPQARPSAAEVSGPLAAIAGRTVGGASPPSASPPSAAAAATATALAPTDSAPTAPAPTAAEPPTVRPNELPTVTAGPPPRPTAAPSVGVTATPTAVPAVARPPRSGQTRRLIVAAVVGALLAGGGAAVGIVLASGDDSGGQANSSGTPTSAPSTDNAGRAPDTPQTAPPSSSAPSQATTPTTPTTPSSTPPASPTRPPLPAGYRLQTHSDGFEVAVPEGWKLTQDSSGNTAYEAADGNHRLVVRVLRGDTADPYAEQSASARETAASAAYPGYRQIELARGTHGGGKSASWEYTYNSADGPRHIKDVRWQVGGTSYNLWTAVPDGPSWAQYEEQLRIALEHFRDTRAG
ncbi:serine/threonine-protein kinase [Yinghuangia sp. YIM S09857]|uniref:serine/threonine-protein kinase n=1 Tax=Yinghuangia sp. YIM S09857 TaxID=3436929 RepID=UPI003F52BE80